jgi:hypothetical protein
MTRKSLCLLILLAACGTPQERCINGVTRDQRTLERLIAESEGNIRRGYAYEEETVYVPVWEPCWYGGLPAAEGQKPRPPRMCMDEEARTTRKAVAIDLAAEGRKLEGLKAKRKALAKASAPAVAQCKAQYPE